MQNTRLRSSCELPMKLILCVSYILGVSCSSAGETSERWTKRSELVGAYHSEGCEDGRKLEVAWRKRFDFVISLGS
ncbi:hypothetical protein F5880DRAFT_1525673, partial [Lentinula raphanica]